MSRSAARPSNTGRAIVAVALFIGFYVLALAVIVGLLYIPYAEWKYAERVHLRLAIGCIIAAVLVFVGMIPRRDHFEPPGPRLKREDHPDLFAMLDDVAAATEQEMPREVYAEIDVNAWVAERGGVFGAGSRRVMALGLPLMRALTVTELRAVLAHEFGHFHGGDTRLGTWVYKTRCAIANTLDSLSESVVQFVFHAYGKLFLRVTQSISRQQEYDADALAARIVGPEHLASGLRKVHGAAVAFGPYLESEFGPATAKGFLPPLSDGFGQFLASERISEGVTEAIDAELRAPRQEPYDSHPPLAHRVAALRGTGHSSCAPDDRPATRLLSDLPRLERDLCAFVMGRKQVAALENVAWSDVTERVFVASWREVRDDAAEVLAAYTADDPPTSREELRELGKRAIAPKIPPSRNVAVEYATHVLGCALAALLVERGVVMRSQIGELITFRGGGVEVEPFGVIGELADGKLAPREWRRRCGLLGIAGARLG
jgi:Zn-dependent protease with chaperone function